MIKLVFQITGEHNYLSNIWSTWEKKLNSVGSVNQKEIQPKLKVKLRLNAICYPGLAAGTVRTLVGNG